MLKKALVLLIIGAAATISFAADYDMDENKYNSPQKAHDLYLKALKKPSFYYAIPDLHDARDKGSVEARITLALNYFQDPYRGTGSFEEGLKQIKPILKLNDPLVNFWAYQGYSRTGNQKEAQKYIEIEKNRPDPIKQHRRFAGGIDSDELAWFNWNYARYTGNGYFNAPYEPKEVCDEVESKYNAKTATRHDTYLVGRCYFDGVVRQKDEKKGIDIFNAVKGTWAATDTLAILYTVGTKYTPQNLKEAFNFYKLSNYHNGVRHLPDTAYYFGMATMLNDGKYPAYETGYVSIKSAADLGHKGAQWLVSQKERNLPGERYDLSIFFKDLPQDNSNKPRFPSFDFSRGVKVADMVVPQPTLVSNTTTKENALEATLHETCSPLVKYAKQLIINRHSNNYTKDELLQNAQEYKTVPHGDIHIRRAMVHTAFAFPNVSTINEKKFQQDVFMGAVLDSCQKKEAERRGIKPPAMTTREEIIKFNEKYLSFK